MVSNTGSFKNMLKVTTTASGAAFWATSARFLWTTTTLASLGIARAGLWTTFTLTFAFFNFFLSALTLIKLDPIPASQARIMVSTWDEGIDCAIFNLPLLLYSQYIARNRLVVAASVHDLLPLR